MAFSGSMITALAEDTLRPFYLFSIETTSTTLYLASTGYDVSWDSKTWIGNGWFRGLSSIKLSEGLANNNVEIALAGASSSVVSLILSNMNQSKVGLIYLGLLDGSRAIVSDPTPIYSGYYSRSDIDDSPSTSVISIALDSETSKIKQPKDIRYTDAAQQNLFPAAGDQGLKYVGGLAEWKGYFGVKT